MREISGGITAPSGFKAGGIHCGIKKREKDLALIYSENEASASAVFTKNKVQSASIKVSGEHLQHGRARAVIVSSGNANTCTGVRGYKDAKAITALVAKALGTGKEDVLIASTGIIGRFLPIAKFKPGIGRVVKSLSCTGNVSASRAIMTTDTFPKEKAVKFKVGGKDVTIGAMGKGAGMICPSMATMLCFVTTDALIGRSALSKALKTSVDRSFHRITVDGDMSTNDSVFILANGTAGNREIRSGARAFGEFQKALDYVTCEISKMIVKDAEGAKKFIEISVTGGRSQNDVRKVAFNVANSNLVKTALGGENANWGRIASAAGSAGANVQEKKLSIFIGGVRVTKNGDSINYDSRKVKRHLKSEEIKISVDLGLGKKSYTVWTSDLTEDYVKINAGYS